MRSPGRWLLLVIYLWRASFPRKSDSWAPNSPQLSSSIQNTVWKLHSATTVLSPIRSLMHVMRFLAVWITPANQTICFQTANVWGLRSLKLGWKHWFASRMVMINWFACILGTSQVFVNSVSRVLVYTLSSVRSGANGVNHDMRCLIIWATTSVLMVPTALSPHPCFITILTGAAHHFQLNASRNQPFVW